jgi:hypothetical protein
VNDRTPCIIELFGRQRIAGFVSTEKVLGAEMARIDVPEVDDCEPFTKFFNPTAIYSVTPTDEATMLLAVRAFKPKAIEPWRLQIPETSQPDSGDVDDYEYEYGPITDDDVDDLPF